MNKYQKFHEEAVIKYTARWDSAEGVGRFADVEVTDYPAWMSSESVLALELDIAREMEKAEREVARAEYMEDR